MRVSVTDAPIDVGSVIASAGSSGDGAVATFVGRVRDNSDGVAVERIDYEAYAEMAEVEMRRIGEELHARGGVSTITIVHRTGTLNVGEASVVVVVAAPHRDRRLPDLRRGDGADQGDGPRLETRAPHGWRPLGRRAARPPRGVAAMTAKRLTHIDEKGRARMVDISDKAVTQRSATARGRVRCSAEAVRRIADDSIAKGSVLDTARLAGIMGAKRTSDLIPLCHPLSLRHIDIDLRLTRPTLASSSRRRRESRGRPASRWRH